MISQEPAVARCRVALRGYKRECTLTGVCT